MITVQSLDESDLSAYGANKTSVCLHSLLAVSGEKLHIIGLLESIIKDGQVFILRLDSSVKCEPLGFKDAADLESMIMDLGIKKPLVGSSLEGNQPFRLVHPSAFMQTNSGITVMVIRTKHLVIGMSNEEGLRKLIQQTLRTTNGADPENLD
jgi:hypothetical protein